MFCLFLYLTTHRIQCMEENDIFSEPSFNDISECSIGIEGNKLFAHYGEKTAHLQPPHKYTPWIIFNHVSTTVTAAFMWALFLCAVLIFLRSRMKRLNEQHLSCLLSDVGLERDFAKGGRGKLACYPLQTLFENLCPRMCAINADFIWMTSIRVKQKWSQGREG